jgi:hypothetical protein
VTITNDYVIQTSVSNELAGALKAHAALRNMLLFDLFVEVIEQFIKYRESLKKKRQSVPYLISPKGGRYFNLRIPEKLALRVQALSDDDNVAARRFVYTAMIHYAVSQRLIRSVGNVVSGVIDRGAADTAEPKHAGKKRS